MGGFPQAPQNTGAPQHTASMTPTHIHSRVCCPAGSLQLPAAALTGQSRDPSSPLSYEQHTDNQTHPSAKITDTPTPPYTHTQSQGQWCCAACSLSRPSPATQQRQQQPPSPKTHKHTKQNPRGGASGTQQCRLMIPPPHKTNHSRRARRCAQNVCDRTTVRECVSVPRTHEE